MKATIHILEAVLGSIIILLGITFIYPVQEQREIQVSETAYNCFMNLDQKGLLKYYASNNMIGELNNDFKNCLPPITNFTFEICSTTTCSSNSIPLDRPVYATSYLISGYEDYNPKLINLWVWLK